MRSFLSRPAIQALRASGTAMVCVLITSCTGSGLAALDVGNPKYAAVPDSTTSTTAPAGPVIAQETAAPPLPTTQPAPDTTATAPDAAIVPLTTEQDMDLASGFVPASRPQSIPALSQAAPQSVPAEAPTTAGPTPQTLPASVNATPAAVYAAAVPPPAPKKPGFLANLFSTKAIAAPVMSTPAPRPKPVIALASAAPITTPSPRAALEEDDRGPTGASDLPGVRRTSLFEIKRRDSLDDDSDVDLHEDEAPPVQLAAAAGLGRLAPNGLLTQRAGVDVSCLKPSLVRMLKQIERHFGKRLVVTSGYRSPEYNKRVRGARRSMHMFCAAVDVHLDGIGKHELARYARAMPGRGGVGTYCHTSAVHIDVGPERDWNWRCRSRKRSS